MSWTNQVYAKRLILTRLCYVYAREKEMSHPRYKYISIYMRVVPDFRYVQCVVVECNAMPIDSF